MVGNFCVLLEIHIEQMRFTGTIHARLDAKGRVFFPSAYRKALGGGEARFVLKRDVYQPCLVVYPYDVWEQEVGELQARLNRWNPAESMLLRQFLSDVEVFSLDANGRFLIPKRFKETGIRQEVAFVGLDDRIEVWDKAVLEKAFLDADAFKSGLQEIMTRP